MYANVVTARLPVYRSALYRRFQPGNCAGIGGGFCRVDAFMTRLWAGVALLQDCLVRSDGGRIYCDFKELQESAKP
jgi:hypothetical protein